VVLASAEAVPAAVEDDHVVELQPLGPVRGQQQQPVLASAGVAAPLGQPLDEWCRRRISTAAWRL